MPAWILPAAMAVGQLIGNIIQQRKQNKENRKLAEFQNTANQEALDKQLEYNTPANQMSRFQDAGLNPNLIYGQGNPGSQSEPLRYPEIKPTDYQRSMEGILPLANQTALAQSQVQAQNAQTRRTGVLTQLNQLQIRVMERNPLLNETGFKAIIDSLKSSAEIKAADSSVKSATADWFHGKESFNINGVPMHGPAGVLKLETELKLLEQRFNLGTLDGKIKAEVLNSKEFQNAILEVQKKWMTDSQVTPQHIYQFIQLLLMKIL